MKIVSPPHAPALAALLLAACAASPPLQGQVGVSEVDAAVPKAQRMTLADNESFQQPLPRADNPLPDYPSDQLPLRLPPQVVCVRVSIDEAGAVSATAPVGSGPDCPPEQGVPAAFHEAAADAALRWRYEPAFRCVFPEGTTPDPSGCIGEIEQRPQAVSLVYRFVFEQSEGQGQVRIAR